MEPFTVYDEISIHAPREGGDEMSFPASVPSLEFQSTPPARGATCAVYGVRTRGQISIHAPREGGDAIRLLQLWQRPDFNPRPPRGGRPYNTLACVGNLQFQSTPPARGATRQKGKQLRPQIQISIHAPREGGD